MVILCGKLVGVWDLQAHGEISRVGVEKLGDLQIVSVVVFWSRSSFHGLMQRAAPPLGFRCVMIDDM